jgi:hypothetical protein
MKKTLVAVVLITFSAHALAYGIYNCPTSIVCNNPSACDGSWYPRSDQSAAFNPITGTGAGTFSYFQGAKFQPQSTGSKFGQVTCIYTTDATSGDYTLAVTRQNNLTKMTSDPATWCLPNSDPSNCQFTDYTN